MNKVAQDYYSQGVLDFFKTASVDPSIREAALPFLVKESEIPTVNLNRSHLEFLRDRIEEAERAAQKGRKSTRVAQSGEQAAKARADSLFGHLKQRNKELKKVKGHRAALGALATLGLGYTGYDLLTDN